MDILNIANQQTQNIHTNNAKNKTNQQNLKKINAANLDIEKNRAKTLYRHKKKAEIQSSAPQNPPYYLIYKIAPGFKKVSVSYEMNYKEFFVSRSA